MSPEFDSLVDGIALFFVFNGLFGIIISGDMRVCGALILIGVGLRLGYRLFKAWRYHE